MGSIDGKSYTNSYEAFMENYRKGTRIFEVDLIFTRDQHLVARHDWSSALRDCFKQDKDLQPQMDLGEFKTAKIYGIYTPLKFEDICELMIKYPDIYIVTDTKDVDKLKVNKIFRYMVNNAERIDKSILNRIIPQIYTPDMFEEIKNIYEWKNIIYTLYQSKQTEDEVLTFVKANNISVVTMPEISLNQSFIDKLLEANIYIYTHTINDKDIMKQYFSKGVWGIYTDDISN